MIACQQTQSATLSRVLRVIATRVAAGSPLHLALAEHPRHFRPEWVEVVRSGEDSGQLTAVLQTLTCKLNSVAKVKSKLVSAMIYPALILLVALTAVIIMIVTVVPTFAVLFKDSGRELPFITQAVLSVSGFLQEQWPVLGAVLLGSIIAGQRYMATRSGRRLSHQLLISAPIFGEVFVQTYMLKFANNVALFLRAGLPLLEIIRSMKGVFKNNVVYQQAMATVEQHVGAGGKMAAALQQTGVFTPLVVSMTWVGEESHSLADVFDQLEEFYRERLEVLLTRTTTILETGITIVMGIVVAIILCAVYLPLFSMSSGIH
jgi:type II secretory pathway component PulF